MQTPKPKPPERDTATQAPTAQEQMMDLPGAHAADHDRAHVVQPATPQSAMRTQLLSSLQSLFQMNSCRFSPSVL